MVHAVVGDSIVSPIGEGQLAPPWLIRPNGGSTIGRSPPMPTLRCSSPDAYRWWPKECGYGGGRSWRGQGKSHGQRWLRGRGIAKEEEEASGDTVFAIGKTRESEEDKQSSVLGCGSTAKRGSEEMAATHENRLLDKQIKEKKRKEKGKATR